jgi:putative flippase GtrA
MAVTETPSDAQPAVRSGGRGLIDQAVRFLAVGILAACVDFGTYSLLLSFGLWPSFAKAISFILGTTTAYLLNRRWTFNAAGGTAPAIRFAVLYTVTFSVNIGVNALALYLLGDARWHVPVAWVIAQGTATVINFVMLRAFVFRD